MSKRLLTLGLLVCGLLLFAACDLTIPDATFPCKRSSECPPSFVCSSGLCRRHASEAGASDDAGDAGEPEQLACEDDSCSASETQLEPDSGSACSDSSSSCEPDASLEPPACTSEESCNQRDDDCDGQIDEGQSALQPLLGFDGFADAQHLRALPRPDGGLVVLFAMQDESATHSSIYAAHVSADGRLELAPKLLAEGPAVRFEALIAGEQLVLAHATDQFVLSAFRLSDLTVLGAPQALSDKPPLSALLDIASSEDALGSYLWVLHDREGIATLSTFRVPGLVPEETAFPLHTAGEGPFVSGRLAAAPCNQGALALLARWNEPAALQLSSISANGALRAVSFRASSMQWGAPVAVARPVLVGGDCATAPSELLLAWSSLEDLTQEGARGTLHVSKLAISAPGGFEPLMPTPVWERDIATQLPPIPESAFGNDFGGRSTLTLARADAGRLFVGAPTLNQQRNVGDMELFELNEQHSWGVPSQWAPRIPLSLEMIAIGDRQATLLVAGSSFIGRQVPELRVLGCK